MASARKDKRRAELDRFLKLVKDLGAPEDALPAEQAIWIICARHGTKEGATKALAALRRAFVDLNELRVAKKAELGSMLKRYVKNDSYLVGRELRGMLWRFHRDQHTMDYGVVAGHTLTQLRKYLEQAEERNKEMALALFLHYCAIEREARAAAEAAEAAAEAAEPNGTAEKWKKRTEREIQALIDRMRLCCTIAIHGNVPSQAKAAAAHRQFVKAWSFSAVVAPPRAKAKAGAKKAGSKPAAPKPSAAKTGAAKSGATKKKVAKTAGKKTAAKKASKKAAPKKAAPKTTAKKKAAPAKKTAARKKKTTKKTSRGGGTSRPKTTRSKKRTPTPRRSSRR